MIIQNSYKKGFFLYQQHQFLIPWVSFLKLIGLLLITISSILSTFALSSNNNAPNSPTSFSPQSTINLFLPEINKLINIGRFLNWKDPHNGFNYRVIPYDPQGTITTNSESFLETTTAGLIVLWGNSCSGGYPFAYTTAYPDNPNIANFIHNNYFYTQENSQASSLICTPTSISFNLLDKKNNTFRTTENFQYIDYTAPISLSTIVGNKFSIAGIDENGIISSWGYPNSGGFGDIHLPEGRKALSITPAPYAFIAQLDDQSFLTWGDWSSFKESRHGNPQSIQDTRGTLHQLPAEAQHEKVKEIISTSTGFTVWLENGELYRWEAGYSDNLEKISLPANTQVTSIVKTLFHTAALLNNQSVIYWGISCNQRKMLPPEHIMLRDPSTKKQIPIKSLIASTSDFCALLENNQIYCWGRNMVKGFINIPAHSTVISLIAYGDGFAALLDSGELCICGNYIAANSNKTSQFTKIVPAPANTKISFITSSAYFVVVFFANGNCSFFEPIQYPFLHDGFSIYTIPYKEITGRLVNKSEVTPPYQFYL